MDKKTLFDINKIDNDVISTLSSQAYHVFRFITKKMIFDNSIEVVMHNNFIAKGINKSVSSVQRAITELTQKDILIKEIKGNEKNKTGNFYKLNLDHSKNDLDNNKIDIVKFDHPSKNHVVKNDHVLINKDIDIVKFDHPTEMTMVKNEYDDSQKCTSSMVKFDHLNNSLNNNNKNNIYMTEMTECNIEVRSNNEEINKNKKQDIMTEMTENNNEFDQSIFDTLTESQKDKLKFYAEVVDVDYTKHEEDEMKYINFIKKGGVERKQSNNSIKSIQSKYQDSKILDKQTEKAETIQQPKNEIVNKDNIQPKENDIPKTETKAQTVQSVKSSIDVELINSLSNQLKEAKQKLYYSQTQDEIDRNDKNFINLMNQVKDAFGQEYIDRYNKFREGYAKWYVKTKQILNIRMQERRSQQPKNENKTTKTENKQPQTVQSFKSNYQESFDNFIDRLKKNDVVKSCIECVEIDKASLLKTKDKDYFKMMLDDLNSKINKLNRLLDSADYQRYFDLTLNWWNKTEPYFYYNNPKGDSVKSIA